VEFTPEKLDEMRRTEYFAKMQPGVGEDEDLETERTGGEKRVEIAHNL
jgi:hypothetical protein